MTPLSRAVLDALDDERPCDRLADLARHVPHGSDVAETITLIRRRLSRRCLDPGVRDRLDALLATLCDLNRRDVESARRADAAFVRSVASYTGLSHDDLAARCGVSRRALAYWMNGDNPLPGNARAAMSDLVEHSRRIETALRDLLDQTGRDLTYVERRYVLAGRDVAGLLDLDDLSASFLDAAVARALLGS